MEKIIQLALNIISFILILIHDLVIGLFHRIVWLFFPNKTFTYRQTWQVKRSDDDWYSKRRYFEIASSKFDYILDEEEKQTLELSPKLSLLTGYPPEFLREHFTPYSSSIMLERDAEIYNNVFIPQVIETFSSIPQQEHCGYSLRCNYRIKHKDNSIRTLYQRTVFTETANNGKLIASASLVEDITGMIQDGNMNGWLDKYTPESHSSLHLGTLNTNLTHKLFSNREIQILELMAEGLPIKQISDKLNISIKTVDRHKENIRNKTGAKNSTELIKIALKSGVIK